MATVRRIGLIVPSSNLVVEPAAAARWHGRRDLTWHIARLRVRNVGLGDDAAAQFAEAAFAAAAHTLADAEVDGLCWAGTASAWLGIERDRELVAGLPVPATTAVLALLDQLHARAIRRVGLLTPFTAEVQAAIVSELGRAGVDVIVGHCLGLARSRAMADVPPAVVAEEAARLAAARPEALVVLCTNLAGWPVAAALERELGLPVLDSVELALAGAMASVGLDPRDVPGGAAFAGWRVR
jgi:maleate isomerase